MTYTKTSWVSGSTIFASALNNLETQYDKVSTDWGPFKFNGSAATSDTKIFEDLSTYQVGSNNYDNFVTYINIPTNIQRSEANIVFTARCCSSGVSINVGYFSPTLVNSTIQYSKTVMYTISSTAFVTFSSHYRTIYPGETVMLYETNPSNNGQGSVKNIAVIGLTTVPTTGIAYST